MRKLIVFLILIIACNANAQVSFIGFDTTVCSSPLTNTYTYQNYDVGSHGHGYKIFKNGVQVYNKSVGSGPLVCWELLFINDSVGFLREADIGMSNNIYKTSNYGSNWTFMGKGLLGYFGLYMLNENFGYLVTADYFYTCRGIYVTKLSERQTTSYFITDTSMNTDIYKTDTIFGNNLCGIDSLKILFLNNLDTITYHINFKTLNIELNNKILESETFGLYPNPASLFFSLAKIKSDVTGVVLLNIKGETIRQYSTSEIFENRFQLSNVQNGLYLVKVIINKTCFYLKLTINNNR
jgi:hypothetical protein